MEIKLQRKKTNLKNKLYKIICLLFRTIFSFFLHSSLLHPSLPSISSFLTLCFFYLYIFSHHFPSSFSLFAPTLTNLSFLVEISFVFFLSLFFTPFILLSLPSPFTHLLLYLLSFLFFPFTIDLLQSLLISSCWKKRLAHGPINWLCFFLFISFVPFSPSPSLFLP